MPTVIFDFDSTLITGESLEEILKNKNLNRTQLQEIKTITDQGMSGEISFLTSLEKRMGMAAVSKKDFISFGQNVLHLVTPHMKELISELQRHLVEIWIVSGTAAEAIIPVGQFLGIPVNRILGVDFIWSATGDYVGIDGSRALNRSKWEGVKERNIAWPIPRIAVGDGITDYALFEHGLVDHFIAFSQNVRRKAILEKGVPEAKTVEELQALLMSII